MTTDGDRPLLVVENKLKDIPRKEQLQRLSDAFGPDGPLFLVVTPLPEKMLENLKRDDSLYEWNYLPYGELSQRIKKLFLPSEQTYHEALVKEYVQLLTLLDALANALFESGSQQSYDFVKEHDSELFEILNQVKLWELYQRIRGSEMARIIGEGLRQRGLEIELANGINHKKATMDFKLHCTASKTAQALTIGIQIEGNQYRRILEMPEHCDEEARSLLERRIWFAPERSRHMNIPLCKYGSTFRYQYEKLQVEPHSSNGAELSFDALEDRIEADLREALSVASEL